jgi:hypothetical protein
MWIGQARLRLIARLANPSLAVAQKVNQHSTWINQWGQTRRPEQRESDMSLKLTAGDLTIHRLIEQETTFLSVHGLFAGLTPDLLAENRQWLRDSGAIDARSNGGVVQTLGHGTFLKVGLDNASV